MTAFNAWRQAWLPVRRKDDTPAVLSLRDTLEQAHDLAGLGPDLTPLDLDALYRFLASVGAVVAREIKPEDRDSEAFPTYAVDAFGDRFSTRFDLSGDRPFLQRWDKTQADIAAKADPKTGMIKALASLAQLHPHEPGESSSKWAVRRDARDASVLPSVALLLVTAWFQTKNGNAQDSWGQKATKGSSGTWHTNPLAVYFTDPSNLARTIFANILVAWIDRDDLPVFLDHEVPPDAFSVEAYESVARFTYAKTLPLLCLNSEGDIAGFVVGPDETIRIPALGKDDKESLGLVHERDHTRLYLAIPNKKGPVVMKPRGSFGGRLSTTEGFERWFRADNHISEAVKRWRGVTRAIAIGDQDLRVWEMSLFSETTDGKGTRNWVAWDQMPASFAGAQGEDLGSIRMLLTLAADCRRAFFSCGKVATGGGPDTSIIEIGQVAFYNLLTPLMIDLAHEVEGGAFSSLRAHAEQVRHAALVEFDHMTDPLITPARVADVARARALFRANVMKKFAAVIPAPEAPTDSKEVA